MKVMLLFPPNWNPAMPHLALPTLTAFLRAHGINSHQIARAVCRKLRRLKCCTRLEQLRLRALIFGSIDGVIDLVEGLPRLDGAALCEQALFDDASHLRAHFGDQVRPCAPGQLARQSHRLCCNRRNDDFRRRFG